MLANIRSFEITIERIDKVFKLSQQKPLANRELIANKLPATGKTSLAAAHLHQE